MTEEKDVDFLEVTEWDDDQLGELRTCGYSYLRQGKYEIAAKFFGALIALDDENPYDMQTYGALLLELDQNEEALAVLSDALKLRPNHNSTLLNQAKALFALGHKDEGLRIVRFLRKNKDKEISSVAKALHMAYA
jgi:predicted Zn-dependent protease